MLTDEQIAELERLEREANPGPWEDVEEVGSGFVEVWTRDEPASVVGQRLGRSDAAFMVEARNLLPSLLAEVRASRAARPAPDANAPAREIARIALTLPEVLGYVREAVTILRAAVPDGSAARLNGAANTLERQIERLRALAGPRSEAGRSTSGTDAAPPAGLLCLDCGKRPATRYARDAEGFGFAMCAECRMDEEVNPPAPSPSAPATTPPEPDCECGHPPLAHVTLHRGGCIGRPGGPCGPDCREPCGVDTCPCGQYEPRPATPASPSHPSAPTGDEGAKP